MERQTEAIANPAFIRHPRGHAAMTTKCPICGKSSEMKAEPIGPFCSTRCKMVDLGRWLGEDYKISEPLRPDHFAGFEELEGEDLDRPDTLF